MNICLLVLVVFAKTANSYPSLQQKVPNGASIPHSCNKSEIWSGVGHELVRGHGPLNAFGRDFLAKGKQWSEELCKIDSDGDGKTNGEELGDPNCKWAVGQPNPSVVGISHPGVCEPIDSPNCLGKNHFLRGIASCDALLNVTKQNSWCPGVSDTPSKAIKTLELTFNQTFLPANDTIYLCQMFRVPADQDYHIVAWEPLIDNYELMHHLVLFTCNDQRDEMQLLRSKQFRKPEHCGMSPPFCQNMAAVWAFGQKNRCYNNQSGVLMGNSTFRYVIMQIHYNNPSLLENLVDSSGFRAYYTPELRPTHTAMVSLSQLDFAIPPGSPGTKVHTKMFTTQNCSHQFLGVEKYRLTSLLFHMHQMGSHAKLVLSKASGKSITIVDEDVTYDKPKFLVWEATEEAPLLEAGDNLQMECTFTTIGMKDYTFFGERTSDEMCIVFMEVFPRPMNLSYFSFFAVNETNTCIYMKNVLDPKDRSPVVANNCSIMQFGGLIQSLANSSTGAFGRNCPAPPEFPAKTCLPKCAKFLEANNFTASNPCMEGATFRSVSAFNSYHSWEQVYHAQSAIDLCHSQQSQRSQCIGQSFISATEDSGRGMASRFTKPLSAIFLTIFTFAFLQI